MKFNVQTKYERRKKHWLAIVLKIGEFSMVARSTIMRDVDDDGACLADFMHWNMRWVNVLFL